MGGASQLYACASLKAIREPTGWIWDGLANSFYPATVTKYYPANSCLWVFAQVCTHWWHWYFMVITVAELGRSWTSHGPLWRKRQWISRRATGCHNKGLVLSLQSFTYFYAILRHDLRYVSLWFVDCGLSLRAQAADFHVLVAQEGRDRGWLAMPALVTKTQDPSIHI